MKRPLNPLVSHVMRGSVDTPEGAPVVALCGKKRRRVLKHRPFVCGDCVRVMMAQANDAQREHRERQRSYVNRLERSRRLALDAADAAFLGAEPPLPVRFRLSEPDLSKIRRGDLT